MIKNEEDYYKPARVRNFWNSNYIEYECKNILFKLDHS